MPVIFRRIAVFCFWLVVGLLIFRPAMHFQHFGFLVLLAVCAVLAAISPLPYGNVQTRLWGTASICAGVLAILILGSHSMLRADSYFELLGPETPGNFNTALPPLDLQKAPLVSSAMARRAAEKRLSEVPALGSQVSIGRLEKQLINGELYWVGLLEHRGLFKWWSQRATPGYVKVSAHDPSEVDMVTELQGKSMALRYLESSYSFDDVDLRVYLRNPTMLRSSFVPEVDDSGRPFLVAAVLERRVLLRGSNVVGALVVDPQTGDMKEYALKDVPAWIDRIQPENLVRTQLSDRLEFVHGWLNPSDKDRLSISGDLDIVYGTDGRSYYFAGHTSVAREGGLVSFSLIDSRTKAATRYVLPGITEAVAQQAAMGVYPEKKYVATNALPFVLEGHPTYVMALTDGTGISRSYAMVSLEDSQKLAVADTLAATARLYLSKLSGDRTRLESGVQATATTFETRVLRVGSEVRGGQSTFFLVLDGRPGMLFTASPDLAPEVVVTGPGDKVEVEYAAGPSRTPTLMRFRNLTLATDSVDTSTRP